jgi:hypothetical protein
MGIIVVNKPGSSDAGGGGSAREFTDGSATVAIGSTTTSQTISAGALYVRIHNAGFAGGGTDDTAQVNGQNLPAGRIIEFRAPVDETNNEFLLLPEFEITANGATVWYEYVTR